MYWAKALAEQDDNEEMKATFMGLAQTLVENEATIVEELNHAQGVSVDIEGYFHPNEKKVEAAMRPSTTLNKIIG